MEKITFTVSFHELTIVLALQLVNSYICSLQLSLMCNVSFFLLAFFGSDLPVGTANRKIVHSVLFSGPMNIDSNYLPSQ